MADLQRDAPVMSPEREDEGLGYPRPLWSFVAGRRARGPFQARVWRSPLRGPWLTSVFALVLLVGLPVVALTGLLSYIAYGPRFGQAIPSDVGWLHLPYFDWPTRPTWLYRLNQGLHVSLGIALVPVVLAKLWSVIPKLFAWPPARSIAEVVERMSLGLLVGSILFELATGLLNIQYDYVFGFDFYSAHYYGGWVFIAAFSAHVALKLPIMLRSLRSRSLREELRTPLAQTRPEPPDEHGLVAADPAEPTISRRGALALVAGGSLAVTAVSIGQTLGGSLRRTALLSSRGQPISDSANDFPVNRTAETAGITAKDMGPAWRLTLKGAGAPVVLDRSALLAMPQNTAVLPIACVEGWSSVQTWTGVRLRDLAARAGLANPSQAFVQSLQVGLGFGSATLTGDQVLDADSLLALKVNGSDLAPDHGFPARVIVPALPGVHNTKWVKSIDFGEA
ncbi:MAG: molybdopterin-dependent oxidoreductase [Nocardioidaceae bacterium]